MSVPTHGETFSKILHHLIKLQEETAMMAHLTHAQDDRELAKQWLIISENFKKMQRTLTALAQGRMQ